MLAHELLDGLRQLGADVRLDDDGAIEIRRGALTDEQRDDIAALKPALVRMLAAERRRATVLDLLERDPALRVAWHTDGRADPCGNIMVAIAVRDIGAAELAIDAANWDPYALLELIAGEALIDVWRETKP